MSVVPLDMPLGGSTSPMSISPRRRGMVMVDLARVGLMRKDREQVTHYATQALDIARQTGSGVITRKLANLQSHILEAL